MNNKWSYDGVSYDYFVDEGLARTLPAIYCEEAFKGSILDYGYIILPEDFEREMGNLRERISALGGTDYSLNDAVLYLKGNNWGRQTDQSRVSRDMVLGFWEYLYHQYGLEKIKEVVTTIGNRGYKERLERIYGKSLEELEADWRSEYSL